MRELGGGRVVMSPDLGMTIREDQPKAEIVPMSRSGGEINPRLRSRIGHEEAIIDAPLIFIQQHPHRRGAWDFVVFGVE